MKRSGVRISYAPLSRRARQVRMSTEHALDLVEQSAAEGGEVRGFAGEQRIHDALVFFGQLGFDEFGDGLECAVDLFPAQSESGQLFFKFVYGLQELKYREQDSNLCGTLDLIGSF